MDFSSQGLRAESVLRFSHLQKARVGSCLLFEAFRFLLLCLLFVLEKGFRLPSHGQAGSHPNMGASKDYWSYFGVVNFGSILAESPGTSAEPSSKTSSRRLVAVQVRPEGGQILFCANPAVPSRASAHGHNLSRSGQVVIHACIDIYIYVIICIYAYVFA